MSPFVDIEDLYTIKIIKMQVLFQWNSLFTRLGLEYVLN
jgi:hypothetical protein